MKQNRLNFFRIVVLTAGLLLLTASPAARAQMAQPGQSGSMNQNGQPNGMQPMPGQMGQQNPQQMEENNVLDNLRRNMYVETQLSKLAEKQSSNADVKKFAGQVVSDNRGLEDEVAMSMANNDTFFSPDVPSQTRKAEKQMKKLTGTQFDQMYLAQMDGYLKDDQTVGRRAVGMTDSSKANEVGMREQTLADQRQKQLTQLAAEENFRIE